MLEKLFESLDEKVFTPELKEALEATFNEAVETKALSIANERIENEIDALNEKSEQHIEFLNKKADEYVKMKQAEMVESLDKYLERVVEEFIAEANGTLSESIKSERADMLIEAFDTMLVATGVKVANIVDARDDTDANRKLAEANAKYNALIEENIALSEENKKLIKMGVISELKEGLSLVESEKFEKLAGLVNFTRSEEFLEKLTTIRESVKGTAEVKDKPLKDAYLNENQAKPPIWAHLI